MCLLPSIDVEAEQDNEGSTRFGLVRQADNDTAGTGSDTLAGPLLVSSYSDMVEYDDGHGVQRT